MDIRKALLTAVETKNRKGWNHIYIAVDIHSTVLKPNYQVSKIPTDFYPGAKRVLQSLSQNPGVKLIMWTSSLPEHIKEYVVLFSGNQISFDFINSNPDIKSEGFGYFDEKFYFNLLLDDKAGFEAEGEDNDWKVLEGVIGEVVI
jgi:hypothetical protein